MKPLMLNPIQQAAARWPSPWKAWPFWALILLALGLRLYLVLTTSYLWDEDREWIKLARSISWQPGAIHLPLQGDTHPVLPAYLIRLGTLFWGETPLGYRFFSLVAGTLTVGLASRLAWQVAGATAGMATGLFLAVSEFHMVMSAVAVDGVFYLFFALLALTCFSAFLHRPRTHLLLATGALSGLGYMCNERTALLLPVFAVALLTAPYRRWLRHPAPWAAVILFMVIISPDLFKGATHGTANQASYTDHMDRIRGIGITPQPVAFYGKEAVRFALDITGRTFKDWAPEYPGLNEAFGISVLLALMWSLFRIRQLPDPRLRLWLALFLFVFGFLVLLDTEFNEQRQLSPQAWYWADLTLLPAALVLGFVTARSRGWLHGALLLLLVGGCLISSARLASGPFRFQHMKLAVSPAVLWPQDGRIAPVQVGVLPCTACDQNPEMVLEKVMIQSAAGWRPATPEEMPALGDEHHRTVLLAVSPAVSAYGLHYRLTESNSHVVRTSIDVLIRPEADQVKQPFWFVSPPAGKSPSVPEAVPNGSPSH